MSEDLTPERFKCAMMASCPSVHRLEGGKLRIVGANAPRDVWSALIGAGKLNTMTESVIEIDEALLDTLKAAWIAEWILTEASKR